jgi:thiol-disulfide isomerase/thioredoxin
MKNIAYLLLPLLVLASSFSGCDDNKKKGNGNAEVHGKFANSAGDTLFLVDVSQSTFKVLDSVIAGENGEFDFYPLITYKGFYNVQVGKTSQQFATLIIGPGDKLTVEGDAKNLGYTWKTDGSEDARRFNEFNTYMSGLEKQRQPHMERMDSIQRTFQVLVSMLRREDSAKIDSLDKVFGDIYTETNQRLASLDSVGAIFVPGSFANIPALRLLEPFDNFAYYEKTLAALEKDYANAPNVKMLRDYVERERPFSKGTVPPEIAMSDPTGVVYRLSSLKGKVVLIDFWASWCAPCRVELPNVVKNYKKYHDQGFEVFSVSLDSDKNAWIAAIAKDKLTWPYHVSDLRQWQSAVVPLYRIREIPKTILLDREGRIIDRDLKGEALSAKLDEIFAGAPAGNKK